MVVIHILHLLFIGILLMIFLSFSNEGYSLGPKRCDTECQPPTMGVNEKSRRYVNNGFGINGQFFDVEYFSQAIPTQNFTVGETIDITLKIFENTGTKYLEHVALSIVVEEPHIGGIIQYENESTITWKQKFDGTKSVHLHDPYNLITIVNVTDFIENNRTIINFQFNVTAPIESKSFKVHMWDYKRNSWNNHFLNALTVTEIRKNSLESDFQFQENQTSLQNIEQDFKYKTDSSLKSCEEEFELIIKITDNSYACVKSLTAKKLVERGWGILLN